MESASEFAYAVYLTIGFGFCEPLFIFLYFSLRELVFEFHPTKTFFSCR